ncbi:MAG: hypothetical protein KGL29_10275 [Alphaproteobacteria bacterium]|nr:hypothetical protein [Alphaproteobacteria bacterium]MDE2266274.1 hypothetical protein [Alphaproteobacteria bacterium]MDE2500872.1 hypothetical protein [Alphaproteobacteria bacterium]
MSEDLSSELLALYRTHAAEEPDAFLDAKILCAARHRRRPHIVFAMATVLLLVATMVVWRLEKSVQPSSAPVSTEASLPPGMADGRGQFLAASAEPERIGMNVHVGFARESSPSGEE